MTNNPTIGGVSRCKTCHGSGWIDNLRSVGAPAAKCPGCAPAVERKELKPAVRVCGAGYDAERNTVWMETGVVEMPIMRKVEVGEELVFLSEAQSTIARLEARIAELESEEPEWSAMQQRLGDENAQLRDRIAELESGDNHV